MSYLTSKSFWVAAAERAAKTASQVAVSILALDTTGMVHANWLSLVSTAGLAALVSVLTSVGSGAVSPVGSPSLVRSDTP